MTELNGMVMERKILIKEKNRDKVRSLRFRLLMITLISVMLLLSLLMIFVLAYIYEVRDEFFEANAYVSQTFANSLETECTSLDAYVESLYADNNSFEILTHQIGMMNRIRSEYYLKNTMQNKATSIDKYGGIFYYDVVRNALRSSFSNKYSDTPKMYAVNRELRKWLSLYHGVSFWGIVEFDGLNYLLKMKGDGAYTVGYFLELDRFYSDEVMYEDEDIQLILVDEDSEYICSTGTEIVNKEELSEAMTQTWLNGYKYLLVSAQIGSRGLQLIMIRPCLVYMQFWQKWYFLLLFISVTVVNVVVALLYNSFAKRAVLVPINKLTGKVKALECRDMAVQDDTYSSIREFREIEVQIDELVRQILDLQYEVFRIDSEKQQIELQSYQVCLKPHFFLNCLKSIQALYQNNDPSLEMFLYVLSDYMRRRLAHLSAKVTVGDEDSMIQDYYSLMSILHKVPVLLESKISEEVRQCRIPAFAIQTFVENSYKYAQSSERILGIKICTSFVDIGGQNFLRISVADNGNGYGKEQLTGKNESDRRIVNNKEHTGIDNLRSRLWLLYGDKAKMILYNGATGGAVAEIYISGECV